MPATRRGRDRMIAPRGRLIVGTLLLGGIILAGTYLVAGLFDSRPQIKAANAIQEDLSSLDPEVLSRPGVADIRKLKGRVTVDPTKVGKPIVGVYLPSTAVTDSD